MKWTAKSVLVWFLGACFVGTIVFYAYYQSREIRVGPMITMISPTDGLTSTSSLVSVIGVAHNAKILTLDGRAIFVDLEGNFHEQLLLMDGYNIIELTAKDGEGRERRKIIEVVYTNPSQMSPQASSTEEFQEENI
jgi:hypothetical protein